MCRSRQTSPIVASVIACFALVGLWSTATAATVTPVGTPVVLAVTGIADVTNVSGINPIGVAVTSGSVTQIQLLVDDKPEMSTSTQPYSLAWDTTKETPGIHTVVVRATSTDGQTTDKKFVVEVVSVTPTATPAIAPTVVSVATPVRPLATTVPTPPTDSINGTGPGIYAAAVAIVIVVVGAIAGGLYVLTKGKSTVAPQAVPAPKAAPKAVEHTVVVEKPKVVPIADGEGTVVAGGLLGGTVVVGAPRPPSARLRIVQQGAESEVVLTKLETVLGREASNPIVIRDPQASRKHARILIENGEFWYEDLKSLNGTKINDEVVVGRRKLAPNDKIKIGEAVLTFTPE